MPVPESIKLLGHLTIVTFYRIEMENFDSILSKQKLFLKNSGLRQGCYKMHFEVSIHFVDDHKTSLPNTSRSVHLIQERIIRNANLLKKTQVPC